jgi:tripartite-type tricarboxylate transporter receptor subunit TctC
MVDEALAKEGYCNLLYEGGSMRTNIEKGSRVIFWSIGLAIFIIANASSIPVFAQEGKFPTKPIEIIVPNQPGGIIDLAARIIQEPLSADLKVPIIIKNQAGAGGMTGARASLTAKPDGYTILIVAGPALISNSQLMQDVPFDLKKDFLPLGYLADAPIDFVVKKTSPFKSWADLVQYAKSNPGKLQAGFGSIGAESHLMLLAALNESKIDVKPICFVGSGPNHMALLGGHTDLKVATVSTDLQYIKSGDVRPILLTRPTPLLPGVPSGPDLGLKSVSVSLWIGFLANSKIPKPVYDRLVSAVEVASKTPDVVKKLSDLGCDVTYKNPRDTSKLIDEQWVIYDRIIKQHNIKLN